MSIRSNFWKSVLANFFLFFLFMPLMLYVSGLFIIAYLPLFILVSRYGGGQTCQHCGKYVFLNPIYKNADIWIWTIPWIPKNCTKCGNPIV